MDAPIGEVDNLLTVVLLLTTTTSPPLDHQPLVNWLAVGVGDLLAAVRVEPLNLTTVVFENKKK